MSFNHRVICKHHQPTDEYFYEIHEVHYGKDGAIEKWTEQPVKPFGETLNELSGELYLFQKACRRPVLELKTVDGKEQLVEASEDRTLNNFDAFEFMDRSYVALDHVATYLGGHIMLNKHPELREKYEEAEKALSELHQAASSLAM
ncbi:hypothetical protein H5P28_16890 [Ruficoccus amylovorans]|uniref:Uncharacterized protein n=1 Tax=Ruficoccus amylovorans TaxID=1804625 RepID=A0A842HJW5_9BACT|nr:hypothetical protein [Ruficoccus amylovorans]MBC2595944.1 hypothetical protein [Ruficoccus amylovorans]